MLSPGAARTPEAVVTGLQLIEAPLQYYKGFEGGKMITSLIS